MERSLITDMPRDKYVERCKQRAFDYLDRGDLKNAVASFVSNMNARPDCELPHYSLTLTRMDPGCAHFSDPPTWCALACLPWASSRWTHSNVAVGWPSVAG